MTRKEAEDFATLALMLARAYRGEWQRHAPRVHALRASQLVTAERRLRTLAEKDCNVGLTPRDERRVSRIMEQVRDTLTGYAVTAEHNGDPRGSALRLHFGPDKHSQPGNTWGGSEAGWAV